MPGRWRWLVALIACALPCAGAGAAPLTTNDSPLPFDEARVAHGAHAATVRALMERRERGRVRRREAHRILKAVRAEIGDGYAWGGSGPAAFDCSGLTAYVFAAVGVALPRSSQAQAAVGRPVTRNHIRPGDLVFFSTAGPGASHVGIATGSGRVVSATNHGVLEHPLRDAYWGGHYVGARRLM